MARPSRMPAAPLCELFPDIVPAGDLDGVDWAAAFGAAAPLMVEIGPGNDAFSIRLAGAVPLLHIVAIEHKKKKAWRLCRKIAASPVADRIRVLVADAAAAVGGLFAPGEVAGFYVNYPDPWPKRRHGKRRLLSPAFCRLLGAKLRPGGSVRVVTDVPAYAVEIRRAMSVAALSDVPVHAPDPWMPALDHETLFEIKAHKAGNVITRMRFQKATTRGAQGGG